VAAFVTRLRSTRSLLRTVGGEVRWGVRQWPARARPAGWASSCGAWSRP